jgi:hypothetical protein
MLFGPTGDRCLGRLPDYNVMVMRAGLPCEPCWTSSPLASCAGRISCLPGLSVDRVEEEIRGSLNADAEMVEATQARGLLSVPACERSRSPEVA